jgi:serine/threonine-protein kinase
VLEKIGTGGMADVYKAVDEVLGRTVAVKVMHPRYAADPSFAQRFRQEAQAAANLVSPNIVNMYDWGADGDTYYMVMEYVRGTDLKSIIQQKGALNSAKVADIGAQVAAALSVAHGYDIIHRDIKPHNIMVQPDGSVKVMDFGIARAGNTTMTQTGSVLGTAHYVSPEQAQGKELQATSDLYSLGVVLYEASTGHLPFDADTPVAVALKQVNEQPKTPRTVNPNVDPSLEAVIVKAMQKNPAARYASADEMRRDLQAVARGEAPSAAGAVAAGAGMAGAAGAAAAAAPADRTAVLPQVGRTGQYPANGRRSATAPKKKPVWPWVLVLIALVLAGAGIAYAFLSGNGKVQVPNLSGMTPEAAAIELQKDGLVLGSKTSDYNDTTAAGEIASQDPPQGTFAEKNTQVNIVISKGPKPFPVPDVVGLADTDAAAKLQAEGFVAVPGGSKFDAKVPFGQVITQTPPPQTMLPKGSQVTYVTSRGKQMVDVPDVTGLSRSAATAKLEAASLKVSVSYDFSGTVDAGDVISQDPTGGQYPAKTTVRIVVSQGKGIEIPSYNGETLQDTIISLKGLGLKPSPSSTTSATADALVTSTDPPSGSVVKKGTLVTIHGSF